MDSICFVVSEERWLLVLGYVGQWFVAAVNVLGDSAISVHHHMLCHSASMSH